MPTRLELILREWEVEIPIVESDKFRREMEEFLEKTGFAKTDSNWENKELGLRLYVGNFVGRESAGAENLHLSIVSYKDHAAQQVNLTGIPPLVRVIEQTIYGQKWTSLKIIRNSKYPYLE